MQESIMGILWFMLFSIGLIIMVIYLRKYMNVERMALIEKGENPFPPKRSNTSIALRFSLILIGGGLGLLCAYFLDLAFHMEEVAYFSMLFLFAGLGLGLSYVIEERKLKKEAN